VTFQWRHLLKVAEGLASDKRPEEQHIRSAVNRAYYAALGEAREFAISKGLAMRSGAGSHQQIWNFLRQQAAPTAYETAAWKSIGDLGLALTADRKLADYIAPAAIDLQDARRVIVSSYQIVRKIQGLAR
jgi:uncharacterized protein (UPF0332 family)